MILNRRWSLGWLELSHPAQRGASDRAIAHQTRHRSLASLDQYIRMESA